MTESPQTPESVARGEEEAVNQSEIAARLFPGSLANQPDGAPLPAADE